MSKKVLDLATKVINVVQGAEGVSTITTASPQWGRGRHKLKCKANGRPNHLVVEVMEPTGKQLIHINTSDAKHIEAIRVRLCELAQREQLPISVY
jgi:hypothetical protein